MPVKTMNQSITCSHSGSRGTARAMGVDKGPLVTVAAPLASEEDVQRIYNWIDEIPLSRPKRPAEKLNFTFELDACHFEALDRTYQEEMPFEKKSTRMIVVSLM